MQNSLLLLLALLLGIAFIVVATTRWSMHPFLALVLTAYGLGLAAGLGPAKTLAALTSGFGNTVGYIGIVIAGGCMIGTVLERSGGAAAMADFVLRITGRKRAVFAMSCTGAIVSVPVFCDSGYVILSPLTRSLSRQTGTSLAAFAVALSMGLYATHCLVPPTPGPLAAAGELRADVGVVILLGLVVVVPVVLATYAYAQFAGRRLFIDAGQDSMPAATDAAPTLPPLGPLRAFTPILVPVLLIATRSVADLPGRPLGDGNLRQVLGALGDPNTAIILGVFLAWFAVRHHGRRAFGDWCGEGLRTAGTIILITAAGGALGGVLRASPLADLIGERLASLEAGPFSILLPFAIAAALKTALGSSTVAMITTASLTAPLISAMGLGNGFGPVLATLAISCGAMVVSHANDSYFWVVTQLSGMRVNQGYQLVTAASGIAGLVGITIVFILALVLN